jgi:hypothetical protein
MSMESQRPELIVHAGIDPWQVRFITSAEDPLVYLTSEVNRMLDARQPGWQLTVDMFTVRSEMIWDKEQKEIDEECILMVRGPRKTDAVPRRT